MKIPPFAHIPGEGEIVVGDTVVEGIWIGGISQTYGYLSEQSSLYHSPERSTVTQPLWSMEVSGSSGAQLKNFGGEFSSVLIQLSVYSSFTPIQNLFSELLVSTWFAVSIVFLKLFL